LEPEDRRLFDRPFDATLPASFTVGHWTDQTARTGCTALLFDRPVPAVVDVRGGAPATRETSLLGPGDLVQSVDALFFTGGSAFGLDAAAGVMRFLHERGRGVTTPAGSVPIVPAAAIFDLAAGAPVWPAPDDAYAACAAASHAADAAWGMVGAGTGATTGRLASGSARRRGGIGLGAAEIPGGLVTAIVVVNSAGNVIEDGRDSLPSDSASQQGIEQAARTSTTLAAVLVDVPSDRRLLTRCAVSAHDALARSIEPCHTIFDGDLVFAAGLRSGVAEVGQVFAAAAASELAVRRAIFHAVTA
jgi:L-aminopeptidase/D-esterase-like protein